MMGLVAIRDGGQNNSKVLYKKILSIIRPQVKSNTYDVVTDYK
jgi:hypothetical protein